MKGKFRQDNKRYKELEEKVGVIVDDIVNTSDERNSALEEKLSQYTIDHSNRIDNLKGQVESQQGKSLSYFKAY